jgi:hypothetical protein
MKLFELACSCRLYANFTDYDESLEQLRTGCPELDPLNSGHRAALLVWLNAWGCRQFAKEYHHMASASLADWAATWFARLPGPDVRLTDMTQDQIALCAQAYEALRDRKASLKQPAVGPEFYVTFGPTGAAKTLFALRPYAYSPWDEPIRQARRWGSDAASFQSYLTDAASQLHALAAEANVPVSALPAFVGRPNSTPPKLIDEYNWVVFTRGCPPPTPDELAQWVRWAAGDFTREH